MHCTIVSPTKKSTFETSGIFLRTVSGDRGILKNHEALIAQLAKNSQVRLIIGEEEKTISLKGNSFLQFAKNEGIILTQDFEV